MVVESAQAALGTLEVRTNLGWETVGSGELPWGSEPSREGELESRWLSRSTGARGQC